MRAYSENCQDEAEKVGHSQLIKALKWRAETEGIAGLSRVVTRLNLYLEKSLSLSLFFKKNLFDALNNGLRQGESRDGKTIWKSKLELQC